jgi:hypothetical protein
MMGVLDVLPEGWKIVRHARTNSAAPKVVDYDIYKDGYVWPDLKHSPLAGQLRVYHTVELWYPDPLWQEPDFRILCASSSDKSVELSTCIAAAYVMALEEVAEQRQLTVAPTPEQA